MAKREEVKLDLPNTKLMNVQQSVNTYSPVQRQKAPESTLGKALDAMQDALPALSGAKATMKKAAEKEQTVADNRAELGDIHTGDGATEAQSMAGHAVQLRNKTHQVIGQLRERLKDFDGDDDEYSALISEAQDEVMQLAGNDDKLITEGAKLFRAYLPQINQTRGQFKEQQRQKGLIDATSESLVQAVTGDYTPQQVRENVAKVISEMSLTGITKEAGRKAVIDTASELAYQKDTTLIDFIKEQKPDWFRESPKLIAAEKQANKLKFNEHQGRIAQTKDDIETRYMSTDTLTEEQWYKEAGKLKQNNLPIYTEAELRAFWNKREKAKNKEFKGAAMYEQLVTLSENPSADPVSYLAGAGATKKESAYLMKRLSEDQAEQLKSYQEEGHSEEDIANKIDEQVAFKAKLLAAADIQDPSWKNQFNALDRQDFQNLRPGQDTLPTGVKNTLATMDSLSEFPATLRAHATDSAIALADNFNANMLDGMDEVEAYQLAWKQSHSKNTMTSKETKEVKDNVTSSIEDQYSHLFSSDIPDEQLNAITMPVQQRVLSLVNAGMPVDRATTMALKDLGQSFYQQEDGKLVRGNLVNWAQETQMSPANTKKMIEELPERIKEDFDIDSGFILDNDVPEEDWYPHVTSNGLIYFTDASGLHNLTRPMPLSIAAGRSIEQQIKDQKDQEKKLKEARDKAIKEMKFWPSIYTDRVKDPYSKWE